MKEKFLWGSATAAYQCEGAWDAEGKRPEHLGSILPQREEHDRDYRRCILRLLSSLSGRYPDDG